MAAQVSEGSQSCNLLAYGHAYAVVTQDLDAAHAEWQVSDEIAQFPWQFIECLELFLIGCEVDP